MRRRISMMVSAAIALLVAIPTFAHESASQAERYVPEPAATQKDMTLFFGPYNIPPGQDINRITLDLPFNNGFYTAIAPNLVDAVTGEEPSHQAAHIHHAHWLRVTTDPNDERYGLNSSTDSTAGLSWVFGTGEEKTQGSLNERSAAEPGGPRYGIFIDGDQPQALIFMVHNKTSAPLNVNILLDVSFVFGTREQIASASGCSGASAGTTCAAGQDFHPLTGKLWGTTFDVPRGVGANGEYVHPRDIPQGFPGYSPNNSLGKTFTAGWNGTIIAGAGHMHPLGKEVVLANLGPASKPCDDVDADGYPGVTIFHSRKMERVPEAFPFTEDYQMGATKPGFRAPVRAGDRIAQFGVYENRNHATYEAMAFSGLYVDQLQAPAPLAAGSGCTAENYGPTLINEPGVDAREGMLNHAWHGEADRLCGLSTAPHNVACERPERTWNSGTAPADTVHIGGFLYVPGDQNSTGPMRILPKVKQGQSLRFVNDDVALGVRHTITSCPWPCNGTYVGNYPLPDGDFDSHTLGNLDVIDGFPTSKPFAGIWDTPKTLAAAKYSYYCRIHPWMRGAFEVTP